MSNIKEIYKELNFRPKKSLGQNFLFDHKILSAIAATVQGGICIEIGPGPGGLTWELAQVCSRVVAIEIDEDLCSFLVKAFRDKGNVEIIKGDFLHIDLDALFEAHIGEPFKIAANMPYYITTPIIMKILDSRLPVTKMTLMMQKEVADRILAPPGSRDYGVLSVMCQARAKALRICDVSPGAFYPPPQVKSTILTFDLYRESIIHSHINDFRRCVRAAFSARRKQIANNISQGYAMSKDKAQAVLKKASIDPAARAEQLSVADYDRLCGCINALEPEE